MEIDQESRQFEERIEGEEGSLHEGESSPELSDDQEPPSQDEQQSPSKSDEEPRESAKEEPVPGPESGKIVQSRPPPPLHRIQPGRRKVMRQASLAESMFKKSSARQDARKEAMPAQEEESVLVQLNKAVEQCSRLGSMLISLDWDKISASGKNSTLQYMGLNPTAYWFIVCSQYFPTHAFAASPPGTLFYERLARVSAIPFIPDPPRPPSEDSVLAAYHSQADPAARQALLTYLKDSAYYREQPMAPIEVPCQPAKDGKMLSLNNISQIRAQLHSSIGNLLENSPVYEELIRAYAQKEQLTQGLRQLVLNIVEESVHALEQRGTLLGCQFPEPPEEKCSQRNQEPYQTLASATSMVSLDTAIKVLQDLSKQTQNEIRSQLPPLPSMTLPELQAEPSSILSALYPAERAFLDYLMRSHQYRSKQLTTYASIDQDAKCQICGDGDYSDDNLIVFCELCNISYHQRCYGINKIPEQFWLCQLCKHFGVEGRLLSCLLCTQRGGCLKRSTVQSDNPYIEQCNPTFFYWRNRTPLVKEQKLSSITSSYLEESAYEYSAKFEPTEDQLKRQPTPQYVWVHLTCAIWVPETYIDEKGVVHGIETIDSKKYAATCHTCSQKNKGVAVQCATPGCGLAFHPECAKRGGAYLQQCLLQKLRFLIYCPQHRPLKITKSIEARSKRFKDDLQRSLKMVTKYTDSFRAALNLARNHKNKIEKQLQKKRQREEVEKQHIRFLQTLLRSMSEPMGECSLSVGRTEKGYVVQDYSLPTVSQISRITLTRNDEIWDRVRFGGLSPSELYKRWKKIMLDKGKLKLYWSTGIKLNREKIRQFLEENPFKEYCLCRRPYIRGELMLECSRCKDWFHFECLGFVGSQEEAETLDRDFFCVSCGERETEEARIRMRQKFGHLFGTPRIKFNPFIK